MHNPYYNYHNDLYQPTLEPQNYSKQNNGSSHQENFQPLNYTPPVPNEFSKRGNHQDQERMKDPNFFIPPSTEFSGHDDHIKHIPYTIQSGSDLERRLNHLSYQLDHIIHQNHQILRYLQEQPEQSKFVSTPSGGSVIVRM